MDKTTVGLIAALGAAIPMETSQAAVTLDEAHRTLHVASITELLDPISNAVGVMSALAAERKNVTEERKVAQLYLDFDHHHHHWHHHHHHHHWHDHHHHHWYHHHHHHHWHNDDDE